MDGLAVLILQGEVFDQIAWLHSGIILPGARD
jgi:hypothetical protein